MIFCTVSTYKHFGLALILATSIKKNHPEAKIVLCLVEEQLSHVAQYRWLFDDIVLAKQLGFRNFYRHMFRHNEIEGPCSCKARLMLHALRRFPEADKFVYLDSDMKVYDQLTEVSTILDQNPIILTPHNFVARKIIVRHGYFNAGFLAIRRSPVARQFLLWWAGKLDRKCYLQVKKGLNADQKWLDTVPRLFGAYTLFHSGYNIGPWNIDERMITQSEDGSWLVNGQPLKLFHFSSILRHPNYASYLRRYISLVNNRATAMQNLLYQIINAYHAEVSMQGTALSRLPWSYSLFTNGRPIQIRSRRVFRRNLHSRCKAVRNPFTKSNLFFTSLIRKKRQLRKRR